MDPMTLMAISKIALPLLKLPFQLSQQNNERVQDIKASKGMQFSKGGQAGSSYIYSSKLGTASELQKALSKLQVPKSLMTKYKGGKHSDPDGGIPVDRFLRPTDPNDGSSTSTRSMRSPVALVEKDEIKLNPESLQGADDITAKTAKITAEKYKDINEYRKGLQEFGLGGELNLPGSGNWDYPTLDVNAPFPTLATGPIGGVVPIGSEAASKMTSTTLPIPSIRDASYLQSKRNQVGQISSMKPLDYQLKLPDLTGSIGQPVYRETSPVTKTSGSGGIDALGLGMIGDVLSQLPAFIGGTEREKRYRNTNEGRVKKLLSETSANLEAQANQVKLAAQGQMESIAGSNRSQGVRNALNAQVLSQMGASLAQLKSQEQQLNSQYRLQEASSLFQMGEQDRQENVRSGIANSQNRAAMATGIRTLGQSALEYGKYFHNNKVQDLQVKESLSLLGLNSQNFSAASSLDEYMKSIEDGDIIKFSKVILKEKPDATDEDIKKAWAKVRGGKK